MNWYTDDPSLTDWIPPKPKKKLAGRYVPGQTVKGAFSANPQVVNAPAFKGGEGSLMNVLDAPWQTLVAPAIGSGQAALGNLLGNETGKRYNALRARGMSHYEASKQLANENLEGMNRQKTAIGMIPGAERIPVVNSLTSVGGVIRGATDPLNFVGNPAARPVGAAVKEASLGAKAAASAAKQAAKKAAPVVGEALQDIAAQGKPTLRPRMGITPGELPKEPISAVPRVQTELPPPTKAGVAPQVAPESAAAKGAVEPTVPAGPARAAQPVSGGMSGGKPPVEPPVAKMPEPGPKQPRKPIWANLGESPQRPPEPQAAAPSELPSGRKPGGIKNQQPTTPVDPLQQIVESLTPEAKTLRTKATELADDSARKLYDSIWALGKLERETNIPAHQLAQVASGAPAHGENILRKYVRPVVQSVGKDSAALEQYMVLKRDEDILARNPHAKLPGGLDGWPAVLKAQKTLEEKLGPQRFTKLQAAAPQMWKINDDYVLTPLRDAGLISAQTYNDLRAAFPHYIDFHRADFSILDASDGLMRRPTASVSSNALKAMEEGGSIRKLDHPLARFEVQIVRAQVLASRNRAAKGIVSALQQAEKSTGQKLVTAVGDKAEHSILTDTISYFDDGKKVTVQVPREYAVAAKNLDAEMSNSFVEFVGAVNRPFKAAVTTYNPAFLIVNPVRDAITAWFTERLIPLSPDYIRGMLSAVMKDETFDELARAGGFMSGLAETQRTTKGLASAARRGALTVRNPQDVVTIIPRLIAETNVAMERGTRIATYMKLRNKGVGELEAAVRARDVTVDFSKAGSTMRTVNQILPFSNAGVQGTANVVRTMKKNPKWAVAAASPLAFTSVVAYVNNRRFPDTYADIPSYEYRGNWVFQMGEGTDSEGKKFPIYVKFPKGPLGAALTSPVEIGLQLADAHNDMSVVEAFLDAGRGIVESTSPISPTLSGITPPIISTGIGLATNTDPYSGIPIVSQSDQNRLPEQQFDQNTSTVAASLGQKFKVSPKKIDFAIRNYSGGSGQMATWLADFGLEALGWRPDQFGEANIKPQTLSQTLSKTPAVSRFIGTRSSGQTGKQYDAFESAVRDSQRDIYKTFPEMQRLGVSYGKVGDSIGKTTLTMEQRTLYQNMATRLAKEHIQKRMLTASYWKANDETKKRMIQDAKDAGWGEARSWMMRISAATPVKR